LRQKRPENESEKHIETMTHELGPIRVTRKEGEEPFHRAGKALGMNVIDYWKWAVSDLLGNTERGGIAEFIVAMDFGVIDGVRNSWEPFDLTTKNGIRVEVKSAAYIQTWKQEGYSQINFAIRPTYGWDAETNEWGTEQKRQSDAYVFCILANKDQSTIDPLDMDQWEFYVLSTQVLNEKLGEQRTVGLATLLKFGARKTQFREIAATVRDVASN